MVRLLRSPDSEKIINRFLSVLIIVLGTAGILLFVAQVVLFIVFSRIEIPTPTR